MILDVAAEVRAVLAGEGLTADALDARIERAVERVLQRRDTERLIGQAELARLLGLSPKALSMRLSRGSELAKIAEKIDGKRVWKRSEIEALLARKGAK